MTVFIRASKPQGCDYCGKVAELRPYGKNGASICFDCGMKPRNKKTTEAAFGRRLNANADPLPPELRDSSERGKTNG
jgi:hypothetical protein